MSKPLVRLVQPGRWFWMQEYVNMTAMYWLSCPADRRIEYGSGVFTNGQPLGSTGKFSGSRRIEVVGVGSVHVRIADGGGGCVVGIWQQEFNVLVRAQTDFGSLNAALIAGEKAVTEAGKD